MICTFSILIVDPEATLEVGAEAGTAEAAQEAGAVPTAVTKATGEPGNLVLHAVSILSAFQGMHRQSGGV